MCFLFFFFNDTATTEIYTLSLHDALPICLHRPLLRRSGHRAQTARCARAAHRSEEHTSELQSPCNLVCRLLLEKKNALAAVPAHDASERSIRCATRSTLAGHVVRPVPVRL